MSRASLSPSEPCHASRATRAVPREPCGMHTRSLAHPALTPLSRFASQVVLNLMWNALKFTVHGFVRLSARATKIDEGGVQLLIEVADSGVGITQEDQAFIFERYTYVPWDPPTHAPWPWDLAHAPWDPPPTPHGTPPLTVLCCRGADDTWQVHEPLLFRPEQQSTPGAQGAVQARGRCRSWHVDLPTAR